MKYVVDVFTTDSVGTRYPENSYDVDTSEECANIIKSCTREIAGIRMVQVWINEKEATRLRIDDITDRKEVWDAMSN